MSKVGVILNYFRQCGTAENLPCHVTIFKKLQIRLFNCKYLQWATLHVDKQCNHSKILAYCYVSDEEKFGLCEIYVITFL